MNDEVLKDIELPDTARAAGYMSREMRKQVEVEEGLESLSRYLDGLFKIPGVNWKFGIDALVGLIPNFGDLATSLISFYILVAGVRYGVPKITLLRMAFNIGLDYVIGIIPFAGDLFDFFWRSNKRNIDLIRERATGKGKGTTSDWLFVGLIILSLVGLLAGCILVSLFFVGVMFKSLYDLLQMLPQ
jgi:hypothetical protein